MRFRGTIVYQLVSPDKTEILLRKMKVVPPTEEDKRTARLAQVMHFWIYDVAIRASRGVGELSPNESKFIRNGKASVSVELDQRAEPFLEKLRQAGLEIESEKEKSSAGGSRWISSPGLSRSDTWFTSCHVSDFLEMETRPLRSSEAAFSFYLIVKLLAW